MFRGFVFFIYLSFCTLLHFLLSLSLSSIYSSLFVSSSLSIFSPLPLVNPSSLRFSIFLPFSPSLFIPYSTLLSSPIHPQSIFNHLLLYSFCVFLIYSPPLCLISIPIFHFHFHYLPVIIVLRAISSRGFIILHDVSVM